VLVRLPQQVQVLKLQELMQLELMQLVLVQQLE
jgi:hypothetical protein